MGYLFKVQHTVHLYVQPGLSSVTFISHDVVKVCAIYRAVLFFALISAVLLSLHWVTKCPADSVDTHPTLQCYLLCTGLPSVLQTRCIPTKLCSITFFALGYQVSCRLSAYPPNSAVLPSLHWVTKCPAVLVHTHPTSQLLSRLCRLCLHHKTVKSVVCTGYLVLWTCRQRHLIVFTSCATDEAVFLLLHFYI